MVKVCDALLHLAFVTVAHAGKDGSPDRHLGISVSRKVCLARQYRGHFIRWILAVFFRQSGQVGGRDLERACGGASFAFN